MASNYTTADLVAIDQAIASGELKVKHQDRYVEYRSLDEMQKIRALIADSLAQDNGSKPARKMFRLCVDAEL